MRDKIKDKLLNKRIRIEMMLFLILISVVALGNNMGDSVFSNYFKEVYNVTASQRAFIEFPRELPGLLCALVIGGLSFLGDVKTVVVTQILASISLMALGLLTPPFGSCYSLHQLWDALAYATVNSGISAGPIKSDNGWATAA